MKSGPTPSEALSLGWSVIPCDQNKKPIIKTWKPFQERQAKLDEVAQWVRRNPAAWGIVTGIISKRITLDFDGVSGKTTCDKLHLRPHRSTPSGGVHVDFDHPGWHVPTLNSKTKRELGARWPGLDIRGDGGYVIFRGRTGHGEYSWMRDPEPESLDALPLDLREFLGLLRPPETITTAQTNGHHPAAPERVAADRLLGMALDRVGSEGRNNAGLWLAAQLRDNRYSQMEVESVMRDYAARCPSTNTKGHVEAYGTPEVLSTVREVFTRPPRQPWDAKTTTRTGHRAPPEVDHGAPDLLGHLHNDHGNAERLIALYGRDLRYCYAFKNWLVWDSQRWAIDRTGGARRLAKKAMLAFLEQAINSNATDAEKFARGCLDARRIESLLSMAQCEIYIRPEELDVNPHLLNFRNGTVNLETSELRPHRREDYITKVVHYNFNPDALYPRFQSFLEEVMGGGPGADDAARERAHRLIDYLQRAIGYSLTGCTTEKAVFVPFGGGDNGKSTLLSTVRQLVEEYAVVLQVDTLMVRQESNNTQADLADLRGARFVQTSETEEGQRLAQGKLKRITQGMGVIKAVRKYENPIEFQESHKLWMDTNRKPSIRDADDAATFSRLHPIPFTIRIPKDRIDRRLPAKLLEEGEGILAFIVAGAKIWYQDGLNQPPEVRAANEEWRTEMDRLARFLAERCVIGDGFTVQASVLFAAYKRWCEENEEKILCNNDFAQKLAEKGFGKRHNERGTLYLRIGLRAEETSWIPDG